MRLLRHSLCSFPACPAGLTGRQVGGLTMTSLDFCHCEPSGRGNLTNLIGATDAPIYKARYFRNALMRPLMSWGKSAVKETFFKVAG